MAHTAKLQHLSTLLVSSIHRTRTSESKSKTLQDSTYKLIRSTAYGSTNQFNVQSKLSGLIEKFSVRNREDLAIALQQRLDDLPQESRWLPEVLSLLLLLSDRPLEKTDLADLVAYDSTSGEQGLSWDEIFSRDSSDESGIWDDVEHGYHSSEDDATESEDSDSDQNTQATSVCEEDVVALARMHLTFVDSGTLERTQHQTRDISKIRPLSELTLIRETLAMLHGLPTDVYDTTGLEVAFHPRPPFRSSTASFSVFRDMLCHFAGTGTTLNTLRHWAKQKQSYPFLQSCQAAVQSQLSQISAKLSDIEQTHISSKPRSIVSLVQLRASVDELTSPLGALLGIVLHYQTYSLAEPFVLLDQLYDSACIAQMSGDSTLFATSASVLAAGLETYLRPVAQWMQFGELSAGDPTFLVEEVDPNCSLGVLWHHRYAFRRDPGGKLSIPTFMQPFAEIIFATGKSRAFLRALTHAQDFGADHVNQPEMAHGPSILATPSEDLTPFQERLSGWLQEWISGNSSDCTSVLLRNLFSEQNLLRHMQALGFVFCSADGVDFRAFAQPLFWRIDHEEQQGECWRDRFFLTELAQSTLASASSVDAEYLSIQILDRKTDNAMETSVIRQLERLQLTYLFPWPLQNITGSVSAASHSMAFVLLLQLHRVKHVLQQQNHFRHHEVGSMPSISTATNSALRLRQRVLVVIDVLHSHVTDTASILRDSLMRSMRDANSIDGLGAAWAQYEKAIETSLMLTERLLPLRGAITTFLHQCEQFSSVWSLSLVTPSTSQGLEVSAAGSTETGAPRKTIALYSEIRETLFFLAAGVRGVSRAGGNSMLERLAERLEWALDGSF